MFALIPRECTCWMVRPMCEHNWARLYARSWNALVRRPSSVTAACDLDRATKALERIFGHDEISAEFVSATFGIPFVA